MKKFDWEKLLQKSALFGCLTEQEIANVIKASQEEHYDKGDIIVSEGESGNQVFVIGEGAMDVTLKGVVNQRILISSLLPGDFFGEMSWLENKPRLATIIVRKKSRLLKFPATDFQDLMDNNARFASKISLILSERLRKLTEEVLSVKLTRVDEKLKLSNAKIDASLKAMESQMKATEAVFTQTSNSANEVIKSVARTRSQVIQVGSAALVVLSLVGGLLTFFGWQNWDDVTHTVDKKIEDIENKRKFIATSSLKILMIRQGINAKKDEIDEFLVSMSTLKENVNKNEILVEEVKKLVEKVDKTQAEVYSVLAKNNFEKLIFEKDTNLYKELLSIQNTNLTEDIFNLMSIGLVNSDYKIRDQYLKMIRTGLEKKYTKSPKQIALSYYYLIAGILLKNVKEYNEAEYVETRNDFNYFISHVDKPIVIVQNLNLAELFKAFLPTDYNNDNNQLKISRLNGVWNAINQNKH